MNWLQLLLNSSNLLNLCQISLKWVLYGIQQQYALDAASKKMLNCCNDAVKLIKDTIDQKFGKIKQIEDRTRLAAPVEFYILDKGGSDDYTTTAT